MNEFQRRLLDAVQYTFPLGQFVDPDREILSVDNYAYSCDFIGIPGTGIWANAPSRSFNLVMDSDSDFVLTYISGGAVVEQTIDGSQTKVRLNPAMLIQITDQSSGRTYFNLPMPLPLIAGFNGFPFLLTSPRLIRPRTTLTVTMSVPNNQTDRRFNGGFLTLHGAKIFYS